MAASGLDVPVRHPGCAYGALTFHEGPVPVPQVQGPPPGPAQVHHRRPGCNCSPVGGVAKYGWVALAARCRAQAKLRRLLVRGRARILSVTVSRDAGGTWYASVCFQATATPAPQAYRRPAGAAVGVDVGVKTAAVVATAAGTLVATLEASRALRDALPHLGHLQRALSRTQKGLR